MEHLQLQTKQNKSAALAAVKILHNNSHASKKSKMDAGQHTVGSQERHNAIKHRVNQFEASDSVARRNKARISGKLKGLADDG